MMAAIPTDLLLRLMNATPEQYAAVERVLGVKPGDDVEGLMDKTNGTDATNGGATVTEDVERESTGAESGARNVFRQAGSHWDVVFEGGETIHLEDTLGAKYLSYLLRHPGEVISAFDLEVAINPDKAGARSRNSIQEQLDSETVRAGYLRELTRLRGEREDAAECGDVARADQLDEDIESVEEALQSNGRGTGDTGERARNNVRKSVGGVINRLGRGDKAQRQFAAHLTRCVSLGFEVMYQPASGEVWL